MQNITSDLQEKFWSFVDKTDSCWIWTGRTRGQNGYGWLTKQKKGHYNFSESAHRVSYVLHFGEIPAGFLVCHRCDTPKCVNPDHLFVGTHRDNMQDCLRKGRLGSFAKTARYGMSNGMAKVTPEMEAFVRKASAEGQTRRQIAAQLPISANRVWAILANKHRRPRIHV